MGLIELLVVLAVIGFLSWLLITYVPMPQPIRMAMIVVATLVVILLVLRAFGIGDIPLPRLR